MADQSSRPLRRSARQRKPVSYGDTEVYEIAPKSTTATTSTRSSKAHGSKGSKVTTRTTRKRKTADVNVDTNLVGDSLQAESTTTRTTRKRKAPDSEDSKVTTTRTTRKRKAADANDDINLVGKSPQAESSIGTAIAANPRRSRRVCASKKNAQQKEEQEQPKKPTKRQGTRKATEPIVEEPAQVVTSTDAVTLNSPRTRRKGHRDLKEAADKKKPSQQKPKDQKQPNRKQQPKKQKDLERNRNQQQEVLERNQDQQQENLERNLNQQQEDLEDQLEEDDEEEQVEEDASEPEESAASFPTHIAEFLSRQGVPVDTGAHALETVVDLRDSGRITAFDGNQLMIQEALRLNEAMQQEAEAQLAWIDERLKMNETLSKTVREFAVRETVANRKRAEIHKKYPIQYQPFVDQQGQTPFDSLDLEEDSDDQTAYRTSKSRPWNMKERKALLGAIHTEARRNMALEFMARGDHRKILDLEQIEDSVLEKCAVNMFDWQRISSLYVKSRTATECRIQWTTQDHPTINKTPWSRDETQKMDALVEKHGYEGQWETIAVELGTNRTAAQCFAHYQAQKNVGASKRKWTPEDDETLREAVDVFGERNWQQVAVRVGGRTGQQCLQRWTKCVNPAIRRHRWEKEEDDALRAAVNVYGVGNWRIIQRHIPGRTDMQCRERWVNCLDPNLDFTPFNEEEIQRLKELYAIHGRKWSLLAEYFPGHTDNQVLREWKAIERGSRRKKQGDKSSVSSADPQDPPASL